MLKCFPFLFSHVQTVSQKRQLTAVGVFLCVQPDSYLPALCCSLSGLCGTRREDLDVVPK